MSLFNIGSAVALATLTSLSLTGLISSCQIAIVSRLSARIRNAKLPPSRFDLSKLRPRDAATRRTDLSAGPIFGCFCNAIAFIFLCVALGEYAHDRGVGHTADHPQTVMMFFPTTPNPRPADMNWSVVMYGFVTVVMLVFYFRRAKYIFDGPVTTVSSQWDTATVKDRTVSAPAWVAVLKAKFPKLAKIL